MKKTNLILASFLLCAQILTPALVFAETVNTSEESVLQEQATNSTEPSITNDSKERTDESNTEQTQIASNDKQQDQLTETILNTKESDTTFASEDAIQLTSTISPISSSDNPIMFGNSFSVNYKLVVSNEEAAVLPAGSAIKINLAPNALVDISKFASYTFLNSSVLDVSYSDSSSEIVFNTDVPSGIYTFTINYGVLDPGWNWDGEGNKTNPVAVDGTYTSTLHNKNTNEDSPIDNYTIYVKPNAYTSGSAAGDAGYIVSGKNSSALPVPPAYPNDGAAIKAGTTYLHNPNALSASNSLYFSYTTLYAPSNVGLSSGTIDFSSQLPIDTANVFLYQIDSSGNAVDITNMSGVTISTSANEVTADFTEYLQTTKNWGNVVLRTFVPVSDIDTINRASAIVGGQKRGPVTSAFQSAGQNTYTPYFRGDKENVIYSTDTLNPLTNLYAYVGTTDITSTIQVVDYDNYPEDGKKPVPGTYTLKYEVSSTDTDGTVYKAEFTRVITVKENKQAISGTDYTMYVGDKDATVADFHPSATDKDGDAIDVSTDLSTIDFTKLGTYDVVLTASDGQTKPVKLTIKDNKQVIDGSDYTMYVGDKDATVTDFHPSATDKDGNAVDVTADLSAIDFTKPGTYDVVLTATDGQTKKVQLTILAKELVPTIAVTDKTMYVGDTLTKEEVLSWATFTNADGLVQGFEVVGTKIPVSADDKLTTVGNYTIKYYVQNKGRAVTANLAEKEMTLTVLEKKTDPMEPKEPTSKTDPDKTIDSGMLPVTSTPTSGKSLPSTGEQVSTSLYLIGTSFIVGASGLYLWMRKVRRN